MTRIWNNFLNRASILILEKFDSSLGFYSIVIVCYQLFGHSVKMMLQFQNTKQIFFITLESISFYWALITKLKLKLVDTSYYVDYKSVKYELFTKLLTEVFY